MRFQIIVHYGEDEEFTIDSDGQHAAVPAVGELVELWSSASHPTQEPAHHPSLIFTGYVVKRDWEYSERITGCHIFLEAALGEGEG